MLYHECENLCLNFNNIFSCLTKIYFSQLSLLVGLGAHEYAIANNIIAVDPFSLISGKV